MTEVYSAGETNKNDEQGAIDTAIDHLTVAEVGAPNEQSFVEHDPSA